MSDTTSVTVQLSSDEALVPFDLLSQPFSPEYASLVEAARLRLHDTAGA